MWNEVQRFSPVPRPLRAVRLRGPRPADERSAAPWRRTRLRAAPYRDRMEQRITLVTLGVRDLPRARSFYEALGWRGQEVEQTLFFQAGGLALVLWDRDLLAADCGLQAAPDPAGFGGIALSHNVRSPQEVDQLLAAVEAAGGTVTKPAAVNAIGFYSSAFTDPDGHAWEVAHNPGFHLAADGSLTLPDFDAAGPGRSEEGSRR